MIDRFKKPQLERRFNTEMNCEKLKCQIMSYSISKLNLHYLDRLFMDPKQAADTKTG